MAWQHKMGSGGRKAAFRRPNTEKKTLIIGLINICACLSTDYSTVHYIIAVLRWFSKFLRNHDDDDDDN